MFPLPHFQRPPENAESLRRDERTYRLKQKPITLNATNESCPSPACENWTTALTVERETDIPPLDISPGHVAGAGKGTIRGMS